MNKEFMLAKPFKEGKMKYPALAQPKINGNRCSASYEKIGDSLFGEEYGVVLRSKGGHKITVDHISNLLAPYFETFKDLILDGELYIPNTPVASISGACRNTENPLHPKLSYVIFDIISDEVNQEDRILALYKVFDFLVLFNHKDYLDSKIYLLTTEGVDSDEDFIHYSRQWVKAGFEGGILRNIKGDYQFGKRNYTMMKLKFKKCEPFTIVNIELSPKDNHSIFICKNNTNNITFSVDGIEKYLSSTFYTNKKEYIGRVAMVEYFERTINDIPLHTTLIDIL